MGATKLISYDPESCRLVGEIVNVSVDEGVLTPDGKVDVAKLAPIAFDPINSAYHVLGKKVGSAFQDGLKLKWTVLPFEHCGPHLHIKYVRTMQQA